MSVFADSLADLYDPDLGAVEATHHPAGGGRPQVGLVYRRNPTTELFGGDIQIADAALRYRTAEFPDVQKGDRFAIGRTEYQVREAPSVKPDGLEATVSLAKL